MTETPISFLALSTKVNDRIVKATSEPIYGGYANARGQISLFGQTVLFRLDLKRNTVKKGPPLNSGAQARYDAAEAGEPFEYCNVKFQRLSKSQIEEICSSTSFRTSQAI